MKPFKVFLLCSLAFFTFSLYEGKMDGTIVHGLNGHLTKIELNTSKNSNFTLAPSVLSLSQNSVEQVAMPIKFKLLIDDRFPLILGFQNYHLELNPHLETNT